MKKKIFLSSKKTLLLFLQELVKEGEKQRKTIQRSKSFSHGLLSKPQDSSRERSLTR
jgi:hypothetical protein